MAVIRPGEYVHVATLASTCATALPSTAIDSAISMKRNFGFRLTSHAATHINASANAL
jgi:hypothetical protein